MYAYACTHTHNVFRLLNFLPWELNMKYFSTCCAQVWSKCIWMFNHLPCKIMILLCYFLHKSCLKTTHKTVIGHNQNNIKKTSLPALGLTMNKPNDFFLWPFMPKNRHNRKPVYWLHSIGLWLHPVNGFITLFYKT